MKVRCVYTGESGTLIERNNSIALVRWSDGRAKLVPASILEYVKPPLEGIIRLSDYERCEDCGKVYPCDSVSGFYHSCWDEYPWK